MMEHRLSRIVPLLAASLGVLLSSCSGGGAISSSSRFLPIASPTSTPVVSATAAPVTLPATSATSTTLVVSIAATADLTQQSVARHSSSTGRTPKYISASAMGVKVAAAGLTTQAFDVSGGSPLCTGSGAGRTCSLKLIVTPGAYTFTLTVYDATPVAGSIPGTANVLGISTVAQTINPNAPNTLNFLVGGQVTSIANGSLYFSLPTNGSLVSAGIAFLAADHGGNTIATGPFSNPITVLITETGGSGHAYLKINGVNVGLSGTLANSTDVATINYDGVGSTGYTDVVTFTTAGSSSSSVRMSPLIVSGSASPTGAGNTANVAITETSAPVSVAYNQALTGCASVATVPAAGAGSGPSGAASVTDTVQPAGGKTCTLTISDNLGSSVSIPVTIPAGTPTCASSAVNTQITPVKVGNGTPCVPSAGYGATTTYATSFGVLTVTEANDQSTLTETDTCAGLATVSPASQPGAGTPVGTANGTFAVTAISNVNSSCNVMIADGNGQTSTFPITIAVQPPPAYACSNEAYGIQIGMYNGNIYQSSGTRCLLQVSPASPMTLSVSGSGGPMSGSAYIAEDGINRADTFTTTLNGNCVGFTHGQFPYQALFPSFRSVLDLVGGNALAAAIGTSCTFTTTDAGGQSISFTFNTVP